MNDNKNKNTNNSRYLLNVYGANEIAELYGVGINKAYNIIRGIEHVNGGLVLGRGHVLWSELQYWEEHRGRTETKENEDVNTKFIDKKY